MTNQRTQKKLKPLKITCTSADCENGLHCFRATRKMKLANEAGRCRYCGAELVDWSRLHIKDVADIDYTFSALKYELFRHYMWHVEIEQQMVNYACSKGKQGLREASEKQIWRLVGPAQPFRDGIQTPRETSKSVNIIHFAQHGTASCCRKCIEYWHGIPQGRELTIEELTYLSKLAMRYIEDRIPSLPEVGEKFVR